MIAIPNYIDREAWDGFEAMRATIKKPLTDRARKLIVYELQRLKDAGHCPNAALDQSTKHCWADVYQPKEKLIEAASRSEADRTKQMLKQREERGYTAPPAELRLVANKIRRPA